MKHLFTLSLALLFNQAVSAKTTGVNGANPFPHFSNQLPYTNSSNTRVVSKIDFIYDGGAFARKDSVSYQYSQGRGGTPHIYDINDDQVYYDNSYSFSFNRISGKFEPRLKRTQQYTDFHKVKRLDFKGYHWGNYTDSLYYTYQFQGEVISTAVLHIFSGASWSNVLLYANTINGQGNVISMDGSETSIIFAYNDHGYLVHQQDMILQNTALVNNRSDSFFYDATDRLVASVSRKFNTTTGIWEFFETWNYEYISGTNNVAYSERLVWENNAWKKAERHQFAYDSHNNQVEEIISNWNNSAGQFVNKSRLQWTYNNNNQPLSITTTSWYNNAWQLMQGDYKTVFQYEIFFPVNISQTALQADVLLFPVPAQQSLNIAMNWERPEAFTVSVIDMQGRVLCQWDEPGNKVYNKTISLEALISGHYFLKINSSESQLTRQFVVAR